MDPAGHYHVVATTPEGGYDALPQTHFVEYTSQNSFNRTEDPYTQLSNQQGSTYETVLNGHPVQQTVSYPAYAPTTTHAMEYVQSVYHMQFAQEMAHGFTELPNLPYGSRTIITSDGKRKRRRIITHEQRKAANIRERRRMFHLNEAFDQLRKRVPTFAYEKKLSRIETLKLAVTYIKFMGDLVEEMGGDKKANISDCSNSDEGLGTSGDSSTLEIDNDNSESSNNINNSSGNPSTNSVQPGPCQTDINCDVDIDDNDEALSDESDID